MAGQFCFCGDLHRGIDVGVECHITWTAVGRFYLALLPLASVLLVVGGITINTVHALGIGPLLRWTCRGSAKSFVVGLAWGDGGLSGDKLVGFSGIMSGSLSYIFG